jgi:hypothetical protein
MRQRPNLSQNDTRWAAVEAARSMRDQAELRARQAVGSVQRADADVALAERRLAAAAAHEAEAARDHRGAEDVLAGHRSAWQCRSADEARRRGEALRREGEWRRDRDAWQAAVDDELGPALLGYLRAVQALREAEGEVERVRSSLSERVEPINRRAGRTLTPEAALDLRLPGALVAAELARRVFPRAQEGFVGGSLYPQRALASGPWGSAPEALHPWREHAESASSRAVATALRLAREAGLVELAPRRARDAAGVAQAAPPVVAKEASAGSLLSRGLRGVFERLGG